jgi:hypothetical protein
MMSPLKMAQTRLLVYSSTCLLEFNVTNIKKVKSYPPMLSTYFY